MKKLEKPLFFNDLKNVYNLLFVVVSGLVTFLIPNTNFIVCKLNLRFNYLFIAVSFILLLIITIFLYIKRIKKYHYCYLKQFKEFNEKISELETYKNGLEENFRKNQKELKNMKNILDEYERFIEIMTVNIRQGTIKISSEEMEYLKNMYPIILNERKYLLKIKGGNIDE